MTAATPRPRPPIRPDWWSKSLAGTLLGFTLAIALSGLFAWAGPGGPRALNKIQFNMWMVAPIWLGVVSFCFLFRSGLRAWLWLGGANLLAYAALHAARTLAQ
ncbi:hypothetical protein [Azospirillum agricola]|uniref:hypothetical protein n=1 Tax=Azospirillum agricola TaxID=1720247 RepID=UPI000A0F2C9A|nr:hypothetical protein [Azospirillum agricola]SMH47201.1 hypothetical protein SAMN02982994_2553 [Azospirillum lipoferum]